MLAIRSNISALHALHRLQRQQANVQSHSQHLSTGQRANSSAEDAVAIQLSSRARNRLAGYQSAKQNTVESIQLLAGIDNASGEILGILHRMRELGVRAQSESFSIRDRAALNEEWVHLHSEINRIATSTVVDGIAPFVGSVNLTFQVGIDGTSRSQLGLTLDQSLEAGGAGLSINRSLLLSSSATIALNAAPYTFIQGETDTLRIQVNGGGFQDIRFNPGANTSNQVVAQINAVIPDLAYDVGNRVFLRAEGVGSNTSLLNGPAPTAPNLDGTNSGQYDTRGGNNIFQLGMDGGGVQNINLPVGAAITSQQVVDSINGVFPGRAQLINRAQASEIQSNQAGPFDIRAGVNDTLNLEVNGVNRTVVFQDTSPLDAANAGPYTVLSGVNDTFRYQYQGNMRVLSLAAGVYQPGQLRDQINALDAGLASVAGGALRLQPAAGSAVQVRNGNMNGLLGFGNFVTQRGQYTAENIRSAINNVSGGLAAVRGGQVVLRPPGSGPSAHLRILNSNGVATLGFNAGDSTRGTARVRITSNTQGRRGEVRIGGGSANNLLGFNSNDQVNGTDNSSASPVLGLNYNQFVQGEDAKVPEAMDQVSTALGRVMDFRARLGAMQRRLEQSIAAIMKSATEDQYHEGSVLDADFAFETAAMTKSEIIANSSMAILGHSSVHGRSAVALLRGGVVSRGGHRNLSSAFSAAGAIRGWSGGI